MTHRALKPRQREALGLTSQRNTDGISRNRLKHAFAPNVERNSRRHGEFTAPQIASMTTRERRTVRGAKKRPPSGKKMLRHGTARFAASRSTRPETGKRTPAPKSVQTSRNPGDEWSDIMNSSVSRIKCCHGCTPPKRTPTCHTTCEDYIREKEAADAIREARFLANKASYEIYDQRSESVYKALKERR